MEGAKAPGSMALPPRSRARPHEHDMSHGAGATRSDPVQSRPGKCWAGGVRARSAVEGSMGPCDEDYICRLTELNAPNAGPLWIYGAPQQMSGTVRCR